MRVRHAAVFIAILLVAVVPPRVRRGYTSLLLVQLGCVSEIQLTDIARVHDRV